MKKTELDKITLSEFKIAIKDIFRHTSKNAQYQNKKPTNTELNVDN